MRKFSHEREISYVLSHVSIQCDCLCVWLSCTALLSSFRVPLHPATHSETLTSKYLPLNPSPQFARSWNVTFPTLDRISWQNNHFRSKFHQPRTNRVLIYGLRHFLTTSDTPCWQDFHYDHSKTNAPTAPESIAISEWSLFERQLWWCLCLSVVGCQSVSRSNLL